MILINFGPLKSQLCLAKAEPISISKVEKQKNTLERYYWLASFIFPGLGHILINDIETGLVFICLTVAWLSFYFLSKATNLLLFFTFLITVGPGQELLILSWLETISLIIISIVYMVSLIDVYLKSNQTLKNDE